MSWTPEEGQPPSGLTRVALIVVPAGLAGWLVQRLLSPDWARSLVGD
jgi:hypothetical protein